MSTLRMKEVKWRNKLRWVRETLAHAYETDDKHTIKASVAIVLESLIKERLT